jgi:gliding motility-associated-like protein
VNPKPVIENYTEVICSDGSYLFTPSNGSPSSSTVVPSGTKYSWSAPSVTGISGMVSGNSQLSFNSGPLVNGTNAPIDVVFTLTPSYTNDGVTCSGNTFTVTVTVNPKPVIPPQTETICSGNAFEVIPSNSAPTTIVPVNTTYTWTVAANLNVDGESNQSTGVSLIRQTLTNTTNIVQTVIYTVTPTSGAAGSCVGNTFTVTVTVNPRPSIQAQTTGSCSGQGFSFAPSNGNGSIVPSNTTYTWGAPVVTGNITGGSSGSGSSLIGNLFNPTNVAQTATYTLTPTAGDCVGGTFTVTVTVNPNPVITDLTDEICSGNTFTVTPVNDAPTVIVPVGTVYTWTVVDNPNVTGDSNQSTGVSSISQLLTNNTNIVQRVVYTVTPSIGGSCIGNTFRVTVTVNPKPVIPAQQRAICSGDAFEVIPANSSPTTIVPVNTTYTWTVSDNASIDGESNQSTGLSSISQRLTNRTNTVQTVIYTVTPTSGAAGSCVGNTFTVTVTVNPKPVITDLTDEICSGNAFIVTPVNSAPTVIVPVGTVYTWTVVDNPNVSGDSNQSTGVSSISQLLTNNTNIVQRVVYTVTPSVGGSCVGSTFTVTVTVNPKPLIPDQQRTICSGNAFEVIPANSAPTTIVPVNTTYTWTVADNPNVSGESNQVTGAASIRQTLTNLTNSVQTVVYTVTPTSGAAGSCVGATFRVSVVINPDAKAQFNIDTNIGCAPYKIRDHVTLVPINSANSQSDFQWYANGVLIGRGSTVPNHFISRPGDTVILKLVAKSLYGCKDDSISTTIYTIQEPKPGFTLSADTACGPATILIQNTSVPINAINGSTYFWDFGNGQTSSAVQPGSVVFLSNDLTQRDTTYYISLRVSTVCETSTIRDSIVIRPGPKALFQPDTTVYCSPATMRFRNNSRGVNTAFGPANKFVWDWGDGRRDTVYDKRTMTQRYTTSVLDTILVKLYAYNECGVDSFSVDIILYPATITPSLIVNGTNTYGCAPRPVTFVNNSIGGTVYTIDFGDGSNPYLTNKSNDTITHRFNLPGTYLVKMRSLNSCTDTTVSQTILVHPSPTAAFSTSKSAFCLVDSIIFNNTSLPSNNVQYIWNFGDGTPILNVKDPVHKYVSSGNYDVRLIVNQSFAAGATCSDTLTKKVIVHPMPVPVFTSNIGPINCAPFSFAGFSNPSSYARVEWIFRKKNGEDIAIQSGYTANYSIVNPGDYSVIMVAYNQFGCIDSVKSDFTVAASPIAKFTLTDSIYCSPGATVLFTNATTHSGTEALTYQWTVDGATVSSSPISMTHVFTAPIGIVSPINYTVKLTSTSTATFCSSSYVQTISILPVPQLVKPSDAFFCDGATSSYDFSSRNTGGLVTYSWTNDTPSIGLPASGTGKIGPFVARNNGFTPVISKITVTPTYTYDGKSCVGPSETFNITINPSGHVDQPSNLMLCNGQLTAVNYSTQNTGGMTTYSWTNSNPSIGIISNNTGNIPTFIAINTTNKPVEAVISVTPNYISNGLSCQGPIKKFTITVLPTAVVDQPVDQVVCSGQTTKFSFSSPTLGGVVTYRWVNDNPLIGLPASGEGNSGSFIATNAGVKPIAANITVTPSYTFAGQTCTGPSKLFRVTVNPTGQMNKLENQSVCNGGSTAFIEFSTNRTGGQTTYEWVSDNISIGMKGSGNGNIPSFVALNSGFSPVVANITVTPVFTYQDLSCAGPSENLSITVNPVAQVNPVANQEACNGTFTKSILFTSQNSGGNTTYKWVNSNPAIGLPSSGTGNISSFKIVNTTDKPIVSVLTVVPTFTNGKVSCTGSPITFTITALPLPQVNFRIVPDSACAPMVINFTNLTQYADTYEWYMDDVLFSSAVKPAPMVLSIPGKNYVFELVASNQLGGCGPVSRKTIIKTLPTPKALFKMNGRNADTITACKSINLNLTSDSYLNETWNKKGLSYQWFINGTLQEEKQANFSTYLENDLNAIDKVYEVKLRVSSASGCLDSISKFVILFPNPLASFRINGTDRNCPLPLYGLQKTIINLSISKNPAQFKWMVSNKTSASTIDGVIISNDTSSNPVFSFPDNITASDSTYSLHLKVTSADGCTKDTALNQIVYARPTVDFKMTDSTSCRGTLNNTFIDISQSPTSSITSRTWNFGDGSSSSLPVVTHAYNLYGTYWPTLYVKNARGCTSDTISKRVKVFGPPVASFGIPSSICLGTPVNTTNVSQVGYGSTKFSQLIWDFGDGKISNAADTVYTYPKPGLYTVTLSVRSDSSCVPSRVSQSITVIDKPKADFTWDGSCVGQVISFENKTLVGVGDKDYELVEWNFGDGQKSLISNPQYTYKNAGIQNVTLIVKGRTCPQLFDSARRTILLRVPRPDSVYEKISATRGQKFEMTALGGGVSYLWKPVTGLANSNRQKTEAYYLKNDPSKIFYTILIKDSVGCLNRDKQEVWVFDSPDVYAPTAFTPNGDNANDVFIPFYINIKTLQSFRIYNRWGNKIFETNDLKKFWDATIMGKQAPMETYTWIVECFDVNGRKLMRKGMVTLIRD